jgi:hypothetical protein
MESKISIPPKIINAISKYNQKKRMSIEKGFQAKDRYITSTMKLS